jgi:hypothetical protein
MFCFVWVIENIETDEFSSINKSQMKEDEGIFKPRESISY